MTEKQSRKVPCPDCGARGVVSVGVHDVKCDRCDGSGQIKASDAEQPSS